MQPQNHENTDEVSRFIQQMAEHESERTVLIDAGVPALHRLVEVANRDTGQSETIRAFLLGLYNGYNFPFNLVSLRSIDKALFDDCIAVLALDARATVKEIHLYIKYPHSDSGSELFKKWARLAISEKEKSH